MGVVYWVFQPHIEQSFVSEWVSESTGIIPTYIIILLLLLLLFSHVGMAHSSGLEAILGDHHWYM